MDGYIGVTVTERIEVLASVQKIETKIHQFDNGVKVYRRHLMEKQRERYKTLNLHEPEEEAWFVKLLSKFVGKDGVFVDVGSGIGYYTILAKKIYPSLKVHSFEPLLEHRKFQRENLLLNGFDPKEIRFHDVALSSVAGTEYFWAESFGSQLIKPGEMEIIRQRQMNGDLATRSIDKAGLGWLVRLMKIFLVALKKGVVSSRKFPVIEVATTTLNEFINEVESAVDILKMDVQGFELDVLKGGEKVFRSRLVKNIIVGTHSKDLHSLCVEFFRKYDYEILFEASDVAGQPDGIIVAKAPTTAL